MEYNNYLKECNNDDVIAFTDKLYKIEVIKSSVEDFLENAEYNSAAYHLSEKLTNFGIEINRNIALNLLNEGLDSEVLRIASNGWKKGKLKLKMSLEFIPDEPEISEYESPLDDIRNDPSFSNSNSET